jgi:beta-glucosidase
MLLQFPDDFIFGTSTSAAQIETAFGHNWQGVRARDGFVFEDTTDHELRFEEDASIISSLAQHYRMSLMWSKLQREAYSEFDRVEVARYRAFMESLRAKGVTIMLVIDHWVHPLWFSESGGWNNSMSIPVWVDFASKVVEEFGSYVAMWNTFNEPNLFTTFSYLLGQFPPYSRSITASMRVIRHMDEAHQIIYHLIKNRSPASKVGVSYNTVHFEAFNFWGLMPARLAEWWYHDYLNSFFNLADFTGISYYARLPFDPFPLTALHTPERLRRLGRAHDDIWEYFPQGLASVVREFWRTRRKPVIITENGICTNDDTRRVQAIEDYMLVLRELLDEGIPITGYYHWSTWDNFEWTLGPTYRFGLYECDPVTKERKKKPSADVYRLLAHSKQITL